MAHTRPARFQRTGTRRISSWPGEHSPQQAGYIEADFLHPPTFPLQSDGGPYIRQVRGQGVWSVELAQNPVFYTNVIPEKVAF